MTTIRDGQPVGIIDKQGAIFATGTIRFGPAWAGTDEHRYEYTITDDSTDGITPDQFDQPRRIATVADLRISDIGKTVRVEYEGTDLVGKLLDFSTDSNFTTIRGYSNDEQLARQNVTTTVKIQLPIATITVPSTATLEIKEN